MWVTRSMCNQPRRKAKKMQPRKQKSSSPNMCKRQPKNQQKRRKTYPFLNNYGR
ncbi:hypothetical protein PIB30_114332, partial [Stylosanthes scabra]|nr:hypothetical protein [Stylosanthes scabra]